MDARSVARQYAVGRAVIGAALIAAPSPLGRPWIGAPADTPGGRVALQALGARDFVIGMVALHVKDAEPDVASGWMLTCAACDAVDFGATLAAHRRGALPAGSAGVVAMAAAGALTGLGLSFALRR